jgi:hypothetical protein
MQKEPVMYQFPLMPMSRPHDLPLTPASTWQDEDDVLDSWLASLSAGEFESVLSHLMDDRARVATVLESTA